ncbi:HAD-IA family hydrolase [Clostridium gasigenes]|uniref:HAD-IA family hydrolase n=1 Tax=Clostridium gasigenes TaxID=94869 RepID=UPI00311AAB3F
MRSEKRKITAVLFDSGRVLNKSSTGHWFISPRFFEYVDGKKYNAIEKEKINGAFRKAGQYINSQILIKTKEEEYVHFKKFYEVFSENLPELELKEMQIKGLATDLVYNSDKYVFFEDALKVIPELKSKYKLAIVSDAWPSLKDVYEKKGLYTYFDSFVISSILGITKPNEKMYLKALDELEILPQEAVFVDDNLINCKGAMNLGIKAILLCRNKLQYFIYKLFSIGKGYEVINNLEQLKDTNVLSKRI